MKKGIIFGGVILGLLIVGIALVMSQRTPRGEYQTERGVIYYFSDGVVAIDTTRTPDEFHIYANHPDSKRIEKAEFIEDGIQITGPGFTEHAKELLGDGELSIGYAAPKVPGKVRVTINHGDWTDGRQMAIDPQTIREFIAKGDWDASVREIWEK